ncbi:DUF3558 family protein [Rhodococcus sp. HNM0569]|uniref:DUF3558 family protein n=1 Tax=Rhodococcus sp. HNM0569 TaxID=2716340 RepID=UPI00146DAC42|nr:DUF3558 family protein [Rhodococcus sp. HNM0569]
MRRAVGLACAAAVVLVGCSSNDEPDQSATPTQEPVSWQPCDAIPADVLAQAGLAKPPDDADARIDRSTSPQSYGCIYDAADGHGPGAVVASNAMTVDDALNLGTKIDETTLDGHRMISTDSPQARSCVVVVEIDPGVITVQVGYSADTFDPVTIPATVQDACTWATGYAQKLAPAFPDRL